MENTPLVVGIVVLLSVIGTLGFLSPGLTRKIASGLGLGTLAFGAGLLATLGAFLAPVLGGILRSAYLGFLFTFPVMWTYGYLASSHPSLPPSGPLTTFVTLFLIGLVGNVAFPRSSTSDN